MIVFDCERMKYQNTGLAVFCDNVASSLVRRQSMLGDSLCMFVPARYRGRWGSSVSYRTVLPVYKLHLFCGRNVRNVGDNVGYVGEETGLYRGTEDICFRSL